MDDVHETHSVTRCSNDCRPPSSQKPNTDDAREQFIRLFTQHERRVYGYILSLVPNWQDADDIAQETNVKLWKEFDRFELGTDFAAWALRIAHFQVLTWRKTAARSKIAFSQDLIDLVADQHALDESDLTARQRALGRCVEELSPHHHDVLLACYAEGAKVKDIAVRLDRSVAAVHKQLQRVRLALHKCVERRTRLLGSP
ncbi:MAG: sigma-70 family RNA polymerase sigma factor [Planctomycetota bacterium]